MESIQREVNSITGIDIILDCVGIEDTSKIGINLLAKGGTFLVVGLLGIWIQKYNPTKKILYKGRERR